MCIRDSSSAIHTATITFNSEHSQMSQSFNPQIMIMTVQFTRFNSRVKTEVRFWVNIIFIIEIVHKVHTQLKIKKKKKVNWHRETE